DEKISNSILQPPRRGLRGHDLTAQERDRDRVVFPFHGEDAALPLQAEDLKDVGQRKNAKRAFKAHANLSRLRVAKPAISRQRPRGRSTRSRARNRETAESGD